MKKRKTTSYTYSKPSQQHQRKARHVLPRGVCLRSKSSLWCVGLPVAWRNALLSITRSSHAFLFTPQTPPLFQALYESLLETQEVHSTAPLKPALATHNRILNIALLAGSPLLSSFKEHFGALCRISLLHSTPSTKSEVA